MTPEKLFELDAEGYVDLMQAPNGDWYAMKSFLFTWAIVEGIDMEGYRRRWCYGDFVSCWGAYQDFIKVEFVGKPVGWIVEK